jgi:hypothetical protein
MVGRLFWKRGARETRRREVRASVVSERGIYAVLILSAQRLRDERSVLHTLPVPRVEQRDHRERWRSMLDSKGTVAAERRTLECLKRALLLHRHSSCSDAFHRGGNMQAGPYRSLHRVQRVETRKAGRRPPATQWLKVVSRLLYWSTEAMIRQCPGDHRSREIWRGSMAVGLKGAYALFDHQFVDGDVHGSA